MSKYLLNVSITPVQEFIAEARKIRDLWIGSYLLSYLTFKALEPFIKDTQCEIIYPHVEDSPFYRIEIERNSVSPQSLQIASLPNHFLVVVPDEYKPKDLVDRSKNSYQNFWLGNIAAVVKDRIQSAFNNIQQNIGWTGNKWDSLWDVQVEDHWQYMWVAIPVTDNELKSNYQDKVKRIQRFLEERKLTRTFEQWKGSTAIKCTQCGRREVLGPEDLQKNSRFWSEIRAKFKTEIREGDRLCAICIIKRFIKASDILKKLKDIRFESTRDIAFIPFRKHLSMKQGDYIELIDKANLLRMHVIPHQENFTKVENIDSIYFYRDEILPKKLLKEFFPDIQKGTNEYEDKKKELEAPSKELKEVLDKLYKDLMMEPSKYYGVLFMDGDNMGKWMSGMLPEGGSEGFTKEKHKERSRRLGKTGNEVMPRIVSGYHTPLVYSGGDDLLALAPVDYLLSLAFKVRQEFSSKGFYPEATTSAGMVIAHYSENLRRVLVEGRKAVERAKELFKGQSKDSFLITLILSSGTFITFGYRWFLNKGVSVVEDVMKRLIKWQKDGLLSPRFIYDVLQCIESFYYYERNELRFDNRLFEPEVKRLFLRHCEKDKDGKTTIPESEIEKVVRYLAEIGKDDRLYKNFDIKENLSGLLRITAFMAREVVEVV